MYSQMLCEIVFVQEIFSTVVALMLTYARVYHVMYLQLRFVYKLQITTITFHILEVTFEMVVDFHDRFGVRFSTKFARVDLVCSRLLTDSVMSAPIFVRFVVGIGRVNLLVET